MRAWKDPAVATEMQRDQYGLRLLLASGEERLYLRVRELLCRLEGWHIHLRWLKTPDAVIGSLMKKGHDVCLLDPGPRVGRWLRGIEEVVSQGCLVPVIFLVERQDPDLVARAMAAGASDCLLWSDLEAPLFGRALSYAVRLKGLQQALGQAHAEIGRRQAEISALVQSARGFFEAVEFKDAAKPILDYSMHLVGATLGCVVLLAEDGRRHEVIVSAPEGAFHTLDPLVLDFACSGFHPMGLGASPVYRNAPGTGTMLQSILAAPLVIDSKPVGLLLLADKPGGFDDHDVQMAGAFGELAAVTLHHGQTLDYLEISVEFFRSVVQTANDAIVSSDSHGNIIFWNLSAEKIYGYSADEIVGKPITTIVPERFRAAHNEGIRRVLAGNRRLAGKTVEVVGLRKDGTEFPVELSIATWKTKQGTLFTGINRDITDRKQSEEALKKAKEEAEIANRAKSEFLANMSHEIRTPLNAVIGMADLLWETPLDPEQQKQVQLLRSAGDTLLNLINDILDLSKVEAGHHLKLEAAEFDPGHLMERTCEVMALRAHEKGLELVSHVTKDVPDWVMGDALRLRQILVNLLGNAIKFTHKGEVVMRVALAGSKHPKGRAGTKDNGELELLFSVADTGIGIPPEQRDVIFESFTQGETTTATQYGGTGLGLSISKRLVELMGGRIWVESEVGKGSTFHFTAHFQIPVGGRAGIAPPKVDLAGTRALVVDDNATNRMILREMLAMWGVEVAEAPSGGNALAQLKCAKTSGKPYHLALIDCRMPGMGGFQVAEQIHCDSGLAGVTIMILTSDHRHNDIDRCRDLGIGGYLVKPIKRSELRDAIGRAMGREESPASKTSPDAAPPSVLEERPLRILLVEDSVDNRLLIEAFLTKAPYHLDTAENGAAGLEKFCNGKYDLVLMDMQMPVMDGYAATKEIRKWEQGRGSEATPIIALTAYAFKEDAQKSLDAGCTAHLTKPIKKNALREAILRYTAKPDPHPSSTPPVSKKRGSARAGRRTARQGEYKADAAGRSPDE